MAPCQRKYGSFPRSFSIRGLPVNIRVQRHTAGASMEISVRLPVIYSPSVQFHSVLRRWASPTERVEGTDMYLYTTRAVALSTQVLGHRIVYVRMRRIRQTRWKLPCDES